MDGEGTHVKHTPELISELFDEELNRIIRALPADTEPSVVDKYRRSWLDLGTSAPQMWENFFSMPGAGPGSSNDEPKK